MLRKHDECFSLILTEWEQRVGVGGDKTGQ